MIHNDVLRRLRYALDQNDSQMLRLFRLGGLELTGPELHGFLAKEGDEGFVEVPDPVLTAFLDGLVLDRRGPRDPSAPARPPERFLDNNMILKKIRIALELEEKDMLELLRLGGMELSPSELGALFRKPQHKHYKKCGDQLLRNFLKGLTVKKRPEAQRPE